MSVGLIQNYYCVYVSFTNYWVSDRQTKNLAGSIKSVGDKAAHLKIKSFYFLIGNDICSTRSIF